METLVSIAIIAGSCVYKMVISFISFAAAAIGIRV